MKSFMTIKEAGALTGKAEITIRRLIKRLINQNDPELTQMIKQEKTPSGYTYKVSTEFLLKEFKMDYLLTNQPTTQKIRQNIQTDDHVTTQEDNQNSKNTSRKRKMADQTTTQSKKRESDQTIEMLKEIIGILREQLRVKDGQLNEKHLETHELIRGNREAIATVNILTKQLQLTEQKKEPDPEIIERDLDKNEGDIALVSDNPEQGNDDTKIAEKKKGFFRFFN